MRSQSISPRHISDALNADRIPIPSDYECAKNGKVNKRHTNHYWCSENVKQILRNPTYLGDLHMLRTQKKSFKHKKIEKRDESEHIVHKNTHPAIISRELWDKCREIDASVATGKRTKEGVTLPLSGLMYCLDCKNKMKLNSNNTTNGSKKTPRIYFRQNYTCGNYARSGKKACPDTHYIKITDIHQLVLDDIRWKARLVLLDEEKTRRNFLQAKMRRSNEQMVAVNSELSRSEKRLEKLDGLIRAAFEEKVSGIMPEDVCLKLLNDYKAERIGLMERVVELRREVEQQSQIEYDVDSFILRVKQYVNAEELTREMAIGLIDHITIGAFHVEVREIHIYYKYLGEF
jgi:hypothetical protein